MQYLHMYCSFRMFKQDKIMNYILENGLTKQSSRSGFSPVSIKPPQIIQTEYSGESVYMFMLSCCNLFKLILFLWHATK